ncbi:MAG: hypothetical protein OEW16_11020 [Gammaproteobacteria bacterium]|nr:hypothetical protein [Gammaproteobacteria bacterium]
MQLRDHSDSALKSFEFGHESIDARGFDIERELSRSSFVPTRVRPELNENGAVAGRIATPEFESRSAARELFVEGS